MYVRAYDREQSLLFGLWTGPSNTDEDYDRAAEDVLLLDREGEGRPDGVVHIAEADPENPIPTAAQRKQLTSAAEAATRAKLYYFCMVTRSALVRGVITAISWFAPRRGTHHNGCRASFDEAVAWADMYRPGVADRLRELRRQARTAARSQGPAADPEPID
jgi:hypothetical protein